jgi:phasin family protein
MDPGFGGVAARKRGFDSVGHGEGVDFLSNLADGVRVIGEVVMASKPGGSNFPFNIDLTEMFTRMKLPFMPDMEALLAAQRRNLEALTEANKVALEGAQLIARRNLEIMQQTMAELSENMQVMVSPEAPQIKAAKQAEMAKKAYEHAVANLKELGEMIQHANAEAVEVLEKRFNEAVDEVKSLAPKED